MVLRCVMYSSAWERGSFIRLYPKIVGSSLRRKAKHESVATDQCSRVACSTKRCGDQRSAQEVKHCCQMQRYRCCCYSFCLWQSCKGHGCDRWLSRPVQALVEAVDTVEDGLHMVLVVTDSHRVTVEVVTACGVTIAVACRHATLSALRM